MNFLKKMSIICVLSSVSAGAFSAISLDRTRLVFDGNEKVQSLTITNKNKQYPYLAQGWIEDASGKKVTSPLVVLPPVQRIEPDKKGQLRIESLVDIKSLPQDRESLFYFNLREIPPKSEKPNTLQLALQSKIKVFYRPEALIQTSSQLANNPFQEKITLIKQGNNAIVKNTTPYYITVIGIKSAAQKNIPAGFNTMMVAPFSEQNTNITWNELSSTANVTYINDFGGRPVMNYACSASECRFVSANK